MYWLVYITTVLTSWRLMKTAYYKRYLVQVHVSLLRAKL